MAMNLDAYYRGLAAERVQQLSDEFLSLSREAAEADADSAAWRLSSLATQLLDMKADLNEGDTV